MAKKTYNAAVVYNHIVGDQRISGLENLGLKAFEKVFKELFSQTPESALPPITRSNFQETREPPSYFALFETLSLMIRQAYYENDKDLSKTNVKSLDANDIRSALVKLIDDDKKDTETDPRKKKPHALKIIGCHIRGDLNLSNLNIPGSIRLIGCVIEGALVADRTKLTTLDLSGSIIKNGISAMYFHSDGAVRLRRCVSEGPVDMGGLRACGTVDFTDSILSPEEKPTNRASYVGDRGILNLAQCNLDKDLRLERSRIYGGINLRGARIGGLFHMNDAILRSPMAHFEYLIQKTLNHVANVAAIGEDKKKSIVFGMPASLSQSAVEKIAAHLHPDTLKLAAKYHGVFHNIDLRRSWERLGGTLRSETALTSGAGLQQKLMFDNLATAKSALRAEQMTVAGPVYARGLRTCGDIRLQRLTTSGGVGLNGSRLRSARDVRESIKKLEKKFFSGTQSEIELFKSLKKSRSKEGREIVQQFESIAKVFNIAKDHSEQMNGISAFDISSQGETNLEADYVLNLEYSKISGDLDLSRDARPNRVVHKYEEALANALKVGGQSLLKRYHSQDECFTEDDLPKHFRDKYIEAWSEGSKKCREAVGCYNPTLIIGDIKLDSSTIGGILNFRNSIFNLSEDYKPSASKSVRARNVNVRLHIDLKQSVGMNGICLTSAEIGGNFDCYSADWKSDDIEPSLTKKGFCHPIHLSQYVGSGTAETIHPTLDLDLAKIGGSARLNFHYEQGPNIRFKRGVVGSETYIFPTNNRYTRYKDHNNYEPKNFPNIDLTGLDTRFFSHNPGAWPVHGNLVVRNIRYETTDKFGHLFPQARRPDHINEDQEKNRSITRVSRILVMAFAAAMLLLFFVKLAIISSVQTINPGDGQEHLGYDLIVSIKKLANAAGAKNIVIAILGVVVGVFLFELSRRLRPIRSNSKPLALYWLNRQRRHLNTRRVENYVVPTEPYIRAAAVLRAESRNTSANYVEVERLRERRRALSLAKAFPAKALLWFIDVFISYGFKPSRGAMYILYYVLFASMAFHAAKVNGIIVPAVTVDLYEEKRILGTYQPRVGSGALRDVHHEASDVDQHSQGTSKVTTTVSQKKSSTLSQRSPCEEGLIELKENHFHSFLFTIDSLVPFIDMDVESEWKIVDPKRLSDILECDVEHPVVDGQAMLSEWAYVGTIALRLLGWSLITALAFSLLTRFETLLVRPNS